MKPTRKDGAVATWPKFVGLTEKSPENASRPKGL